jgi:hypothetical protein
MLSTIHSLKAIAAFSALIAAPPASAAQGPANCRVSSEIVRLDHLPEASGVAGSRRTPGMFWAHNDSADPVILALDQQGAVKGRVRVNGASVDDWEDLAVGPCPQGSCVYIADIGDNDGSRKHITLYRVPEPTPGDAATGSADVFRAEYPDGPHDAESVFITRDADVFLITKGDPGSVALYRFPRRLISDRTMRLQQVGGPMSGPKVDAEDRPTAADASSDGQWIAVRTTHWVAFYRTADLIAGRWREAFRMDLTGLREPRGEGIAFAGSDSARASGSGAPGIQELVLVGEADRLLGGAGTFARLACRLSAR